MKYNQNSTMELIGSQNVADILRGDAIRRIKDVAEVYQNERVCAGDCYQFAIDLFVLGYFYGLKAD